MKLSQRIDLLEKLGTYLLEDGPQLKEVKKKAYESNKWFTEEFTGLAIRNIANLMLKRDLLNQWAAHYQLDDNILPRTVGIVMAGNIPLVGFHDFLSVFVSGHRQMVKLSEKDRILLPHLVDQLTRWEGEVGKSVVFADLLAGCDAYIATGSNNSARHFHHYFGKYPSLIRSNMTSVAILTGSESIKDLESLADDVHTYFGLGCRSITHLYVPAGYEFENLLQVFKKYEYLMDHTKYRNNYDYNLALLIMNQKLYMTNGSTILTEGEELFAPVSQLFYTFYGDKDVLIKDLQQHPNIQCIIGKGFTGFGQSQMPGLFDYADGADVMQFLLGI